MLRGASTCRRPDRLPARGSSAPPESKGPAFAGPRPHLPPGPTGLWQSNRSRCAAMRPGFRASAPSRMAFKVRSRNRTGSRSPVFASAIMRLATSNVAGSSRSTNPSAVNASSKAATRTAPSPAKLSSLLMGGRPAEAEPSFKRCLVSAALAVSQGHSRQFVAGHQHEFGKGFRRRDGPQHESGAHWSAP